ncbi:hypothetical protein ACMG4M_05125 [Alcanivorax sp. IL3]|uniref:hypothetical protein n=1 Tax=Alcanivorax sp. IL3 TaxID=3396309 RepID=UPI0039C456BB
MASWFWSSATAAWIQAVVAIAAIIFANSRAKQSFKAAIEQEEKRAELAQQEERKREHLNHGKNLARVKVVISNIVTSMEIVLRIKAQNGGSS